MDYTQLTGEQLQEMRKAQLLQYEADFAQADMRLASARAVVSDPASDADALAAAKAQVEIDTGRQAALDLAHAAVLIEFKAADAAALVATAEPVAQVAS